MAALRWGVSVLLLLVALVAGEVPCDQSTTCATCINPSITNGPCSWCGSSDHGVCAKVQEVGAHAARCPTNYRVGSDYFFSRGHHIVSKFDSGCDDTELSSWTMGLELEINANHYRVELAPAPARAGLLGRSEAHPSKRMSISHTPAAILKKGAVVQTFARVFEAQCEESTTQKDQYGIEYVSKPVPLTSHSRSHLLVAASLLHTWCMKAIDKETEAPPGGANKVVLPVATVPGYSLVRYGVVAFKGQQMSPQVTVAIPLDKVYDAFETKLLTGLFEIKDVYATIMAKPAHARLRTSRAIMGFAAMMASYARSWYMATDASSLWFLDIDHDAKDGVMDILLRTSWQVYYHAVDPERQFAQEILAYVCEAVRPDAPDHAMFLLGKVQLGDYYATQSPRPIVTSVGQWVTDILAGRADQLRRVQPSFSSAGLQERGEQRGVIVEYRHPYGPPAPNADCAHVTEYVMFMFDTMKQWLNPAVDAAGGGGGGGGRRHSAPALGVSAASAAVGAASNLSPPLKGK